ncbi:unnamed protein product, partial [Ectocarpus sp. 13 AM-2016]
PDWTFDTLTHYINRCQMQCLEHTYATYHAECAIGTFLVGIDSNAVTKWKVVAAIAVQFDALARSLVSVATPSPKWGRGADFGTHSTATRCRTDAASDSVSAIQHVTTTVHLPGVTDGMTARAFLRLSTELFDQANSA